MSREQQILKTAYDILGNNGLEGLHARTVAKELGINHATVHYYFKRRDDLLLAVADYTLHQLVRDRVAFQAGVDSAGEKVETEISLAEAYANPTSRFIKVLAGLYVASVDVPSLKAKLASIWSEWRGYLAEQIEQAKSDGSVNGTSVYADADMLLATFFGLGLVSHMHDGAFDASKHLDAVFSSLMKS